MKNSVPNIHTTYDLPSGFTKVPNSLFFDSNLSLASKGLYCWLAFESGLNFNFSPTRSNTLFNECPSTINKLLKELEEHKYLRIDSKARYKGQFDYNHYHLLNPSVNVSPKQSP